MTAVYEEPRWVDHDHILAPATAATGSTTGDGVLLLDAQHPDFPAWARWLESQNQRRPAA